MHEPIILNKNVGPEPTLLIVLIVAIGGENSLIVTRKDNYKIR